LLTKICKTVGLILILTIELNAQTYNHTTFWSRLGFQKEIKNFEFRLEFDYRTQNDFQKSTINPFQKRFLQWFRFNTIYKTGKFTHTIILPNQIKTYPLVANKADLKRLPTIEWRYSFFEEFNQPFEKLTTSFRFGYEFRNQTSNNITRNTGRIRFRLNETWQISKKSRVNMSFEPLYNIGPNKAPNTFSQNQFQLRYNHRFNEKVNFTTGYLHLFRKRNSLIEYDLENGIICYLQIGL
jgi:Protein of unknown function (DUF2490)